MIKNLPKNMSEITETKHDESKSETKKKTKKVKEEKKKSKKKKEEVVPYPVSHKSEIICQKLVELKKIFADQIANSTISTESILEQLSSTCS